MYTKQIEQLVILQQLDEEILELEQELEGAPKEVADLEAAYQALEEEKSQLEDKMNLLKEQKQRLGQEVEDDTLKIRKSKNKLMMASNTREYHAMMREMDNLEKLNRMREEENIALSEEMGRQEEALTELNGKIEALGEELKEKQANLSKRLNAANKDLDSLKKRRAESGKAVPPPILARYEFIRSRLKHPVIVSVDTGVCGGCNISIPPQTFNELQRGKQIHSCPNCQRLIYWCEHMPAEQRKAS